MSDVLVHYHLYDYRARAVVAISTATTREAMTRHDLDPMTTIAMGRAISCTAMLASILKVSTEYILCNFAGQGGLISKVVAECNGLGNVRGYVSPHQIATMMQPGDQVPASVGAAMGNGAGTLSVTRAIPGSGHPYTAICALMNGEIAADVARYLTESEQIPSAVAAGVKLDGNGKVLVAGGVLVQKLAGTDLDDKVIADLEYRMSCELNLTERLLRGETADDIARFLNHGAEGYGVLTTRPLQFKCTCSRERMSATLSSLGEPELRRIKEETGHLEVKCPYCSDVQVFKIEELIQH